MTEHQQYPAPPYKQLRRPTDDRMVAGVCSGIARYLSIDPNVVRVLFAVVTIVTWGTALLAYPIMWFIMPEEPGGTRPAPPWAGANAPVSPPHPPAA